MTAVGTLAFAVLVWGAVALVLAVFVYEAYAVARDLGIIHQGT